MTDCSRQQAGEQIMEELALYLAITLVMLIWGVASEALRNIITGFLDQVRFD